MLNIIRNALALLCLRAREFVVVGDGTRFAETCHLVRMSLMVKERERERKREMELNT